MGLRSANRYILYLDGFSPSYFLTYALNPEGRWRVEESRLSFWGAPCNHLLVIVTQSDLGCLLTPAHKILPLLDIGTMMTLIIGQYTT